MFHKLKNILLSYSRMKFYSFIKIVQIYFWISCIVLTKASRTYFSIFSISTYETIKQLTIKHYTDQLKYQSLQFLTANKTSSSFPLEWRANNGRDLINAPAGNLLQYAKVNRKLINISETTIALTSSWLFECEQQQH